MSKSKSKKEKALSPKKELRQKITGQLQIALTDLKEKLGKKEFEGRVKKAVKLLTAGIKLKARVIKNKVAKKASVPEEVPQTLSSN